jgi:hypothetical protein
MDVHELLTNISKATVPQNIPMKEIINMPNFHASMKIQIWNNEIYTPGVIMEERCTQILNQLKEVLLVHKLPNVVFVYCTRDCSPDFNKYIFTHAIISGMPTNNIAAPCFTFYDWNINGITDILKYEDTKESLRNVASNYMVNLDEWSKKEDTLIFVGALTEENHRIKNTAFGEINGVTNIIVNSLNVSKDTYISREELAKYKYLLHLNGHVGAYSSRLKYLLMTGSLCFYITDYENSFIQWLEYWMFCPEITKNMVITKTVKECEKAVAYYNNNKQEAYEKANRAYVATHQLLEKENVLLYWKVLLETYHSRTDVKVDRQIFFSKFE